VKISGQSQAEKQWSVSSGKPLKRHPIFGGQFAAESGGQFERILQFSINCLFFITPLFYSGRIAQTYHPAFSVLQYRKDDRVGAILQSFVGVKH